MLLRHSVGERRHNQCNCHPRPARRDRKNIAIVASPYFHPDAVLPARLGFGCRRDFLCNSLTTAAHASAISSKQMHNPGARLDRPTFGTLGHSDSSRWMAPRSTPLRVIVLSNLTPIRLALRQTTQHFRRQLSPSTARSKRFGATPRSLSWAPVSDRL